MSVQIQLFGMLADVLGRHQLDISDVYDTDGLKSKILKDHPKLNNYQFVIAVSKKIVNGNQVLNSGDVVALLPPFAGG